jgi:signal transduction histidine kinase
MHRLFWKLFLSYWVALVLFAAATMLAASQYLDRLRHQEGARSPHASLLRHVAQARAAAERLGLAGLRAWAWRVDHQEAVPVLVLDGAGRDLLGRPVPAPLAERLARRSERRAAGRERHHFLAEREVRLPDGGAYILVADFQGVTLARIFGRPRVLAMPLMVAALVSGLVCLLLARYLTAPVERLRRATEAYAAGDLGLRVGPSLGRRHDEIADLARAFDRMAEQLQALMASQRGLLRDLSHELRSPLARVHAALGLARQRAGPAAEKELDRIEREADRLGELIGQILSLARMGSGALEPRVEPVDLGELLETVTADAALEAQARDCRVSLEGSAAGPLQGDAALLHSALENVVRNAVRYTAPGSTVTLTLEEDPDWVWVGVRDRGPGVPEEMLSRLFEPFVRVGEARDRRSGGYGLGLAIAERAVRVHGGEIRAHNHPEGGLVVTLRLPVSGRPAAG